MQKESIFFNQKGATAVEFAIVLSLLITLIFGIIEFGLFIFNRQVITNAAREGARYGIVARPERLPNVRTDGIDGIKDIVDDYAEDYLITFGNTENPLTITIKPVDNDLSDGFDPDAHRCVVFGCDLEVQVDYNYEFLFLSNFGIGPIDLRSTSVMRME